MRTLHVVGDSISQQYGPFLETYLEGVLHYSRKQGMPGDPDEPNGANGGDSSLVLRYLSACKQLGSHTDYLLLNCGLHDIKTDPSSGAKQVPPEKYGDNLKTIITVGRTLATHVVWVRTAPVVDSIHNSRAREFHRYSADVERYNQIADGIMRELEIPIIDLFGFTVKLGEGAYLDHVHYQEWAQRLQAAFIAGYLGALIA